MGFSLHQERKIKIAYNPKNKKWSLKLKEIIYPNCDIESVRNWYFIESSYMNITRKEDVNINDFHLSLIQSRAEEHYREWRKAYPKNIFPNEKYELDYQ